MKKITNPTIYVSTETLNILQVGDSLSGIYHSAENTYNLIPKILESKKLGQVIPLAEANNYSSENILIAIKDSDFSDGIEFKINGQTCHLKIYDLENKWFSRNSGILENKVMLNKIAIIIGAGSVGSAVAVQLAKSGVGNSVLIDCDTVEPHNIARSQYSIQDIGKSKVEALKTIIKLSNPVAKVITRNCIIEQVEKAIFDEFCQPENTIIIGAADDRQSDKWASEIAGIYQVPFISIGLWKRASVGEIFYYLPGENPCYECAFRNALDNNNIVGNNKRFYVSETEKIEANFEPGLSIDINFVTLIGLKLIIDLFNRYNPSYVPKVINYLSQLTLICNTNEESIGGKNATIFAHPLQITNNITVNYLKDCSTSCQHIC